MKKNMSFAVRATDRCNLDCEYCYAKVADPQDMSLDTLKRILSEMANYCDGEIVVSWTGGEPLLMGVGFFNQAVGIQRSLNADFANIMQTNATLLDDRWIEFLSANRFQVRTSLDLPPEIHDEMRLKGNFSQTLEKIRRLQEAGIPINVNTVITNRNINAVEEIYAFLKRLAVSSFSVSRLVLQGNALRNEELAIRQNVEFGQFLVRLFDLWVNDQSEPIIQRITPLDKLVNACKHYLLSENRDPCFHCQEQLLAIGPGGDIYPSCNKFFGLKETCLGNISEQNLPEVLSSRQRADFLQEVRAVTDKLCSSCEFLPICEGGCFYVSYTAKPVLERITRRDQFCKGYYVILARIMEYLKGGEK